MTDNLHSLVAPYAVDAVEADERAAFEAHLADCGDCRDELASLRVATEHLTAASAHQAPAALKGRVLASASISPQGPPKAAPAPSAGSAGESGGRRRRLPWIAAAAALAVVIAGAGSIAVDSRLDERTEATALDRDVMMVTSAPDAHAMDVPLGNAHVVMSEKMHGVVVMGADVPMPADGMEYQAWLVLADGSYLAGPTFMPDEAGVVLAHMDAPMEGVTSFAITAEPHGGSAAPTGAMLAEVSVA